LRGIRPHTYTNGNCYTDANSYGYSNEYAECHANSHAYGYGQTDTHRQAEHNPEVATHAAAAPIALSL